VTGYGGAALDSRNGSPASTKQDANQGSPVNRVDNLVRQVPPPQGGAGLALPQEQVPVSASPKPRRDRGHLCRNHGDSAIGSPPAPSAVN
jgi:hypothetical protein